MKKVFAIIAMALSLSACHIVDTGKVGLRKNFNKTIEATELPAGSINQTFVGSVIEVPVKEISVDVVDQTPIAADNSTMSDFDATIVYNINPTTVSDLFSNKSQMFHEYNSDGEVLLMHAYLKTVVRNAIFKVARKYDSMAMNDHRQDIEAAILAQVHETLADEKLDTSLIVTQVQVKSMKPSDAVVRAANDLVKAKSELMAKEVEVSTARKEAERIAALNANAGAINYMNAQAQLEIAHGIAAGKVNTIIVPYDFKGIVNAGNK